MQQGVCFLLLVALSALCLGAQAQSGSTSLLHSTSLNPSPAPGSGSGTGAVTTNPVASPGASVPAPVKEEEVRHKDSSVRLLRRHHGGKLLIFENVNNMVKVDMPKTTIDHAAVEEEARKSQQEEVRKREADDKLADQREQRAKRDRDERDRQQTQIEEMAKKKQVEDAKAQAAETDKKSKLEDQVKEQQHKAAERQAQETYQKKVEKEREADDKRRVEDDTKTKAKQAEQDDKSKAEAKQKASQISIGAGFKNFGYDFANVRADVINNLCFLSGLLAGQGGEAATLPAGCRPTQGRLIFTTMKSDTNARVDVLPDGRVIYVVGGGNYPWLSLSNIWFPITTERPLALVNGWVNYQNSYRPTTLIKQDGLCVVSGLIGGGSWGIFTWLPEDCRPAQQLIFSGNNHATVTRLDVTNAGSLFYAGGSANYGWVNLDGVAFVPGDGGQDLPLANGYTIYGNGWRYPRVAKIGQLCVVSGLARSATFPGLVTTLPENCRPRAGLVFGCNVHYRDARLDVFANGQVYYSSGKTYDWISLDCIKFVTG